MPLILRRWLDQHAGPAAALQRKGLRPVLRRIRAHVDKETGRGIAEEVRFQRLLSARRENRAPDCHAPTLAAAPVKSHGEKVPLVRSVTDSVPAPVAR